MSPISPAVRAASQAAAQHGLITLNQCLQAGMSRSAVARRTSSGAWTIEQPGVYRVTGVPLTSMTRTLAAVLSAGEMALASHRSAAHLWGLEGFGPPGRVEITVRRHARRRPRRGVIVHESAAFDLADPRRRSGVPVTGPARSSEATRRTHVGVK